MRGNQRLGGCITWWRLPHVCDFRRICLPFHATLEKPPCITVGLLSYASALQLAVFFKLLKQFLDLFEELSHSETQKENMTHVKLR